MKLIGELKKQVDETKNKEEAKELIENAGMLLTDDELDNVTGGYGEISVSTGGNDDELFGVNLIGVNDNSIIDNNNDMAMVSVDGSDGFDLLRLLGKAIQHQNGFHGSGNSHQH